MDKCIHCHKCRDNCAFLKKYGIDICDTDRLKELAYHCFLCGRCTEVCPVGIDGRAHILSLRQDRASSDERKAIEKTYKGLISEKRDYRYRNWKHANNSIFFPGCNFPSLYPKTNQKLVDLFSEHNIGTVYECCGKPIAELGLIEDENRIIQNIKERIAQKEITEIITACPNCKDFFADRLGVQIKSVYTKLQELGIGKTIDDDVTLYIPCPDRTAKAWVEDLKPFINGQISTNDAAQCCGLGGSAAICEPKLADSFVNELKENTNSHLYTYCASCMGRFHRQGYTAIDHILPIILGTNEKPDIKKSYLNRMLTKLK